VERQRETARARRRAQATKLGLAFWGPREQELGEVAVEVEYVVEEVMGVLVAARGATSPAPCRIGRRRLGLAARERIGTNRGALMGGTMEVTGAEPHRQEAAEDAAGGCGRQQPEQQAAAGAWRGEVER
jgi:hypothetical protein